MTQKIFPELDNNLREALTHLLKLKKYSQALAAGEKSVKMGSKDKDTLHEIKKIKKILKK